MPKRKSSISYLNTQKINKLFEIPEKKKQKTKISKVYSGAGQATRKTAMHAMALNTHTANI